MWAALDINVLAHAEGLGHSSRSDKARLLVARMLLEQVLVPAQTLGKLYRVLTDKAGFDADDARTALLIWSDTFEIADSTGAAIQGAVDIVTGDGLQIFGRADLVRSRGEWLPAVAQ